MGKCHICGERTSYNFPLCKYHYDLKEEGIVVQNEFGEYVLSEPQNKKCLICEEKTTNNNIFCKSCYKKVKTELSNFDHNRTAEKIEEHYYNLKKKLHKSKNKNEFEEKIILMRALAEEFEIQYDYYDLIERVNLDIIKGYSKFNENIRNNKETLNFNDEDFRNTWPREHQCEDGHYVRSLSEMLIDNWLYNHNFLHAYEKSVFMESNHDAIVISDFYLPQGDVYIEFWGLDDNEKYQKRKEEKIKLYDENKLNRIDLTEKDIKRLNDILPRLLSKYIKR